jgi:predicted Na+-dependent transporter
MLSWGLLVIVVNVVYLLLYMLIGYLAYKFFKDKYKHIGKIVL